MKRHGMPWLLTEWLFQGSLMQIPCPFHLQGGILKHCANGLMRYTQNQIISTYSEWMHVISFRNITGSRMQRYSSILRIMKKEVLYIIVIIQRISMYNLHFYWMNYTSHFHTTIWSSRMTTLLPFRIFTNIRKNIMSPENTALQIKKAEEQNVSWLQKWNLSHI